MKLSPTLSILAAGLLPALAFGQTYNFTAADLGFIFGRSVTTATTNADNSYTLKMGSNTEFVVGYLPSADTKTNWLTTVGNSETIALNWVETPNTDLAQSTMRVGFFDARGTPIVAGSTGRHAGDTNPAATDDFGYWWNISALGGTSASFAGRNTAPASGNLMGTLSSPTVSIGGSVSTNGLSSYAPWTSGVTYTWAITYTRLTSGIGIEGKLTGTDGTNFIVDASDPGVVSSAAVTTQSVNMATPTEVGFRWAAASNITTLTITTGSITYVPEPATYAACLGALSLVIVGYRRIRARR